MGMIKIADDRVVRGFLSGVLAGIPMLVLDVISGYIGFAEILYRDWAASLVLGYLPHTTFEKIIGHVGHLFFAGTLGILFSYFLVFTTLRAKVFKGALFSLIVWFSVHVIVSLFHFAPLLIIPPATSASDAVTALVYGVVLANILQMFGDD